MLLAFKKRKNAFFLMETISFLVFKTIFFCLLGSFAGSCINFFCHFLFEWSIEVIPCHLPESFFGKPPKKEAFESKQRNVKQKSMDDFLTKPKFACSSFLKRWLLFFPYYFIKMEMKKFDKDTIVVDNIFLTESFGFFSFSLFICAMSQDYTDILLLYY